MSEQDIKARLVAMLLALCDYLRGNHNFGPAKRSEVRLGLLKASESLLAEANPNGAVAPEIPATVQQRFWSTGTAIPADVDRLLKCHNHDVREAYLQGIEDGKAISQ